jgi:hypothetical protein
VEGEVRGWEKTTPPHRHLGISIETDSDEDAEGSSFLPPQPKEPNE